MKYIITAVAMLLAAHYATAQPYPNEKMKRAMDSVKAAYLDIAALKNPVLRQAGVSFETLGGGRINSRLYGQPLLRGRSQVSRLTAFFNVPVAQIGKTLVSAGFGARRQTMDLYDVESYDPALPVSNMRVHKTVINASISLTHLDSIFDKPVVYSITATAVADPESWQRRLVFSGVISLTVKQTRNTSLSVGLLGLIDPTSVIPVLPFVRYYHKFNAQGTEIFFDPTRIALRKELTSKHFLWIGNYIGSNLSLFKVDYDKIPHKSSFITLDLKSGLTYEYRLTRKTVLSIGGGLNTTMSSKVLKQNENRNPFIKNRQNIVPYAQVSVSCLPFWKGLAH